MCFIVFTVSIPAKAHEADMIYVRLEDPTSSVVDGGLHQQQVKEVLTLTAGALVQLAPVDADGNGLVTQDEVDLRHDAIAAGIWEQSPLRATEGLCQRLASSTQVKDSFVELTAVFTCPSGELFQTFKILSVLPSGFRVVAGRSGLPSQQFAQGTRQTLVLSQTTMAGGTHEGGAPQRFGGWVRLGVHHIFTGIDHLAFLFALLLVGGTWKRVLAMVTSFTVAHSLTLGATALGIIVLPERLQRYVEALIAASILYVAVENLIRKEHRHRVGVTFLFGLVHGFGFASVLASYGLGESAAGALFGFNLGVELGQAGIVVVAWPLLRMVQRRQRVNVWAVRVGSSVILAAGGFWLTERLLG